MVTAMVIAQGSAVSMSQKSGKAATPVVTAPITVIRPGPKRSATRPAIRVVKIWKTAATSVAFTTACRSTSRTVEA